MKCFTLFWKVVCYIWVAYLEEESSLRFYCLTLVILSLFSGWQTQEQTASYSCVHSWELTLPFCLPLCDRLYPEAGTQRNPYILKLLLCLVFAHSNEKSNRLSIQAVSLFNQKISKLFFRFLKKCSKPHYVFFPWSWISLVHDDLSINFFSTQYMLFIVSYYFRRLAKSPSLKIQ